MTLTVLTAADQIVGDLQPEIRLRVMSAIEPLVERLTAREVALLSQEQELVRAQSMATQWEASLSQRERQLARSTEAMLAQPAMAALEDDARQDGAAMERKRVLSLIDQQLLWLLPTGHCLAILKTLRRKIEFS